MGRGAESQVSAGARPFVTAAADGAPARNLAERRWRLIAEARVRTNLVVVLAPAHDLDLARLTGGSSRRALGPSGVCTIPRCRTCSVKDRHSCEADHGGE